MIMSEHVEFVKNIADGLAKELNTTSVNWSDDQIRDLMTTYIAAVHCLAASRKQ